MPKVFINGEETVEVQDAEGLDIVHMTVDDKEIAVAPGQTILEAVARMPGIGNIPTLCYYPTISPYGACRLCTVEASEDGGNRFRFVTACLYPIKNGLIVKTNTEKIRKLRKGIIELLLARCPNVKILHELAAEYGVTKPRYAATSEQDCILCGLCVRACEEGLGRSAISLANRGIYKEVAAPFYEIELGDTCSGCGDCAFVCPTGAIVMGPNSKPILPKIRIPVAEIETMVKKADTSK